MKAIIHIHYGPPEVLKLGEVESPEIGQGEVLVRIHAAGVDPGIWHTTTGQPRIMRVMGFGFRAPKTRIPGSDMAGTVEAVGSEVEGFRPGDPVFGGCRGAYAEYGRAKVVNLVHKPSNLTFEQAAAVLSSGLTALQALRDKGSIEAGQRVLIVGASGGVGSFAVQIAKSYGAEVTGVCSTAKVDFVRSLGADHVIDYQQENIADGPRRHDLVIDTGGNRSLTELRHTLASSGTLVLVGGEGAGPWLGGLDRFLRAMLLSPFVGHRLRPMIASVRSEDLRHLAGLIERGDVIPAIDRTFPLAEAAEALRYLIAGRARGKVVLTL